MRQTYRSGETPEHNWTETSEGDAPCSIEINTTAKGTAQFTIKLTFRDADELKEKATERLINAIEQVKTVCMGCGLPLAGQ